MAQIFEEHGYHLEVASERGDIGWKATARAWPMDGVHVVDPIHTIARHSNPEDAERIALGMLRDLIRGNHVAR
jgi:hypothetical protein